MSGCMYAHLYVIDTYLYVWIYVHVWIFSDLCTCKITYMSMYLYVSVNVLEFMCVSDLCMHV